MQALTSRLSGLDRAALRCLFSSRSVLAARASLGVADSADAMKRWAVINSYLWVRAEAGF